MNINVKHDFSYLQDAKDFDELLSKLQELYLANLKFQTVLDSAATRTVLEVFKPITTNPQLEEWWTVHGFQEAIHSASYAELIKALPLNATKVFDDIMINEDILSRAREIVGRFDDTVKWNAIMITDSFTDDKSVIPYCIDSHKKSLVFSLYALNILEAGLFQTSFITTFAFAENGTMESSGKSMSKIAQDEINHKAMTQHLINRMKVDPNWKYIFEENYIEIIKMYKSAYEADFLWIDYIFRDGARLLGLNAEILKEYAQWNIHRAMSSIGLEPFVDKVTNNPCQWSEKYTKTSNLQVALNESDGINYLLGKLNKNITQEEWKEMKI
ncbi:MAG: ribonucleotide-diphosphate reductase subunit beta [Sulfurimonas sp.]|nr:ribonucleotide-diphosphate reductase subunit beta [Sulfurimonas sp.]